MNDPEQVVGLWSPPKKICLEVQVSEKRDPATCTHTEMRTVGLQLDSLQVKPSRMPRNRGETASEDMLAALEKE